MNGSEKGAKVKYSKVAKKDYKDYPHHAPSDIRCSPLQTNYTYYRITATEKQRKDLFNTSSQHPLLDTTNLQTLSDQVEAFIIWYADQFLAFQSHPVFLRIHSVARCQAPRNLTRADVDTVVDIKLPDPSRRHSFLSNLLESAQSW